MALVVWWTSSSAQLADRSELRLMETRIRRHAQTVDQVLADHDHSGTLVCDFPGWR
jgi:hypothetical protein